MLTVVVPTWNEAANVPSLLRGIESALDGAERRDFEILVMDDDSPDGTANAVESAGVSRARVVIRRGRPRGLAAAVLDGFREARGDVLAVLDADGSHPPEVLPRLLDAVDAGAAVAVGSRYVPGGGSQGWPASRRFVSLSACWLARPLTPVRDATSGFFALRREVVDGAPIEPRGFKIGLEVLLKGSHGGRVREIPYVFRDRARGKSKFGLRHVGAFLAQLLHGVRSRA